MGNHGQLRLQFIAEENVKGLMEKVTLVPGQKLGVYEIVEHIASGGMGEVYRAHDERLGRAVAVKIINPTLAENPEELQRFRNEARTLAALSHPNILNIFDIGQADGFCYAVTELLTGKNLRERMAGKPLPWRTAVPIAIQVATGLATAHVRGIVHRDLKPENIFLLADGGVKILDFGLARCIDSQRLSQVGTPIHGAVNDDDAMIGSFQYMSPEQVERKPADARADVFALGAVLFEMLVGRSPFSNVSIGQMLAAILHNDPPSMKTRGHKLPSGLERVVLRCLEKEPEKRFQAAYDLAFALNEIIAASHADHPVVRLLRSRLGSFIAGLALGLSLGAILVSLFR